MIYGSNISWVSPTKPAKKSIRRAFDQLVSDGKGRELDRSILDAVSVEASALRPRGRRRRPQKLDEYLESIRDIERDHAPPRKSDSKAGAQL